MLYELTDNLGNVRAVIMRSGTSALAVSARSDYYPFGMVMPNQTDGSYRYAFQGQEKDGETGMEAFELRLWDGRLGRWLTVDPYHEFYSPYVGMGNNPISLTDPDGGSTQGGPGDPPPIDGGMLQEVVIKNNSATASLGAVGLLVMDSSIFTTSSFGTTTITAAGVGTVAATGSVIGAMAMPAVFLAYLIENPAPKLSLEETIAFTGVISCTAGPGAYRPERPELMPNFNDIMAATATTQAMVHEMGKGKQGQWDDELSPLSDNELLALLKEAIATANTQLKLRIIKEQKRRGTRNKNKDRGRGDVK